MYMYIGVTEKVAKYLKETALKIEILRLYEEYIMFIAYNRFP